MIERIKLRLFLVILFLSSFSLLSAQFERLDQADSLFASQKFTEALQAYEGLYSSGFSSASMLLRMAYIHDGLGNYPDALYYLDQYYLISADRLTVGKISELSENKDLKGYSYSDLDYFQALLQKNRLLLITLLGGISALLLVVIYRMTLAGQKPMVPAFLQIVALLLMLVLVNFSVPSNGVIIYDGSLFRSGPSAGAEAMDIIQKGHKVQVLERGPVWTKIEWEGREGYIRNSRIRVIG